MVGVGDQTVVQALVLLGHASLSQRVMWALGRVPHILAHLPALHACPMCDRLSQCPCPAPLCLPTTRTVPTVLPLGSPALKGMCAGQTHWGGLSWKLNNGELSAQKRGFQFILGDAPESSAPHTLNMGFCF